MPRLPEASDVQQVGIARDPGARLRATDSGLAEVGAALEGIAQKFQAADDDRQLSNLTTQSLKNLTDFNMSLEADPDSFADWTKKHEEFVEKERKRVAESANARVFSAWEKSFARTAVQSHATVASASRKKLVEKGVAERNQNLLDLTNLAINSENPEEIFSHAESIIESGKSAGFYDEVTAQKTKQNFYHGVDIARFENILLVNPSEAAAALDRGDFVNIPEAEKPKLRKELELAQKRKEREEEAAVKKQQEDTMDNFAERLFSNKPPSLREIDRSSLSGRQKLQWKGILEREAKGDGETDDRTYANIVMDIYSLGESRDGKMVTPEAVKDSIFSAMKGGTLKPGTGGALLERLGTHATPKTKKDAVKKNQLSQAMILLQRMDKANLFDSDDEVKDGVLFAKATDDLYQWAEANPDSDPIEYVEKNMLPKQKEAWWKKILSVPKVDSMGEILSKAGSPVADTRLRNEALQYLRQNKKQVNEETITKTMEYLRGK